MDEDVVIRIGNARHWDLIVPRNRVKATYESGCVTLVGVADHAYQRTAAEADVRRVPEVIGVRNEVVVDPAAVSH